MRAKYSPLVQYDKITHHERYPPPTQKLLIDLPIILHIKRLYKHVYITGNKLSKRDKLGLHTKVEHLVLECLLASLSAALLSKQEKLPHIKLIRRNTEALKHLVRMEQDLAIIKDSTYLAQIHLLEDISMMATGWQRSLPSTQNPLV